MPYSIRKAKCKQTDGDRGNFVLSYTDEKGKKHRNCHTSRKGAKGQIAAIEMDESVDRIDESWVPLAARITSLLEEELAALAGSFNLHEINRRSKFKEGDRVRLRFNSAEIMVHTGGVPVRGTIVSANDDGTYDVKWDGLEELEPYRGSADDDVSSSAEDNLQRNVSADEIVVSRSKPRVRESKRT